MDTAMQEATTFMFWVMIFGIAGLISMISFAWFFSENEVRRRLAKKHRPKESMKEQKL
ncbi:hypothetical protein [Acidithiobacillus thiooxidans]|jgi:Mg2+/citrate symporter|uniref:Uncharacterized protein n=1 Tax=Acidithiobacillus thiooxidans ATCC 19377 TaxID=637390 RepID=A0A543Q2F0_ACITH|nr:hypothetical protein [Acidithiobacillus thiooxidans]MDX5935396.1 hypothetical protein [Acidithiobacillus thiooxidans]QFX96240.1 hypothetical protein GCD22_01978 [Acidithiobacillus thiooxidans ATCC 19377]TQN50468.1 hypothetical protein DLNHIDIE_00321 [Acidithiobacillus thiooxidans ATCC 19377]